MRAGLLAIVLVVGLVVFVGATYSRFRSDVQLNRERLRKLGSGSVITFSNVPAWPRAVSTHVFIREVSFSGEIAREIG
jgi:hypothetical protein